MEREHDLARAILSLAEAIRELSHNEIKLVLHRIENNQEKLMSQISEYVDKVNESYTAIGESVDEIITSVGGLTTDVGGLKDIILKLENNPGPISPEDQALLTDGVTKVTALAEKMKGVASQLKDLDAQTDTSAAPTP